jgi:hypothetical protein
VNIRNMKFILGDVNDILLELSTFSIELKETSTSVHTHLLSDCKSLYNLLS